LKKKKLYYTPDDGGPVQVVELASIDADEALRLHPDQYKLAPNGTTRMKANEPTSRRWSEEEAAAELGVEPVRSGRRSAKAERAAAEKGRRKVRDVTKRAEPRKTPENPSGSAQAPTERVIPTTRGGTGVAPNPEATNAAALADQE
jgi:hypothetical protein